MIFPLPGDLFPGPKGLYHCTFEEKGVKFITEGIARTFRGSAGYDDFVSAAVPKYEVVCSSPTYTIDDLKDLGSRARWNLTVGVKMRSGRELAFLDEPSGYCTYRN